MNDARDAKDVARGRVAVAIVRARQEYLAAGLPAEDWLKFVRLTCVVMPTEMADSLLRACDALERQV